MCRLAGTTYLAALIEILVTVDLASSSGGRVSSVASGGQSTHRDGLHTLSRACLIRRIEKT
jgi:hypothetical protein